MPDYPDLSTLLANARHETVTKKRLTELKGGIMARYLYDKPLIEYLQEDEQPEFIFAARKNAPKFSGLNPPTWSGESLTGGMAMHMITDSRWVMVAGKKDGDESFEVSLENVKVADYQTGATKHEISIEAGEFDIDIPIANKFDSADIERIVNYIRGFESSNSEDADPEEDIKEEQSLKELRESDMEDGEIVRELVSRAHDDSVTIERLTNEPPLFEYLSPDEQPHFILPEFIPEFYGELSTEWGEKTKIPAMHMATDRRWLIVQSGKDGEQSLEIPFDQISSIEAVEALLGYGIVISTDEGRMDLTKTTVSHEEEEIVSVVDFVRNRADIQQENAEAESGVTIIDRTGRNPENPLYAKLIVPTKTEGATISQRGWNIGGDIVRRTSSSGKVEKEPWENYVKRMSIYEDHVEIGVTHGDLSMTSDNQIHQNQRVDLNQIQDIRYQMIEGCHGFIFETDSDVYKFKLTNKGTFSRASKEDAKDIVYQLKQAAENAPEQEENKADQTNDANNVDSIEKLSRIKELHEDGILTDEEFEEKKQELLDQI